MSHANEDKLRSEVDVTMKIPKAEIVSANVKNLVKIDMLRLI